MHACSNIIIFSKGLCVQYLVHAYNTINSQWRACTKCMS